jgi:hypothetical protein
VSQISRSSSRSASIIARSISSGNVNDGPGLETLRLGAMDRGAGQLVELASKSGKGVKELNCVLQDVRTA